VSDLDRESVPVRCRPWPVVNSLGLFSKNAFSIDLRRRRVTCPAGRTAEYTEAKREAVFEADGCNSCSLRSRCTTAKKGRTVLVHPQEALLRKLQRGASTKTGRERLRVRVAVEHRLARIQISQGGKARYMGERKNTFDLRRHAAVANLVELQRAKCA
jgi:hypothetical protein